MSATGLQQAGGPSPGEYGGGGVTSVAPAEGSWPIPGPSPLWGWGTKSAGAAAKPLARWNPGSLAEAGPVELVLVGSQWSQSYAVWRQMLNERDYLGSGPLAGHQLRYLIRGPGARLGALAFGVAALQVEARDRWIGWSAELWRENLPYVINQSRFLILPWVGVEKLASHIPGLVISRVAAVWLERLGYGPVLAETFVDLERCRGACYQAVNLKWVRMTRGRGSQDRDRSQKPVETAALGPSLVEGFSPATVRRARHPTFGVQAGQPSKPRIEPVDCAEEEFGEGVLGDGRLDWRLLREN
ncbi:MAG: Druantia anti-phage system protein DruA [Limisphaerales bacterium]